MEGDAGLALSWVPGDKTPWDPRAVDPRKAWKAGALGNEALVALGLQGLQRTGS